MVNFTKNSQIVSPTFSLNSGTFDRSQFLDIINNSPDTEILYSLDGSFPDKKYYEEITIRKSCIVKAIAISKNEYSEISEINFEINKPAPIRGNLMIIGGAEHCQELHQKFVELAGGIDKTKIVFIPASSSEPYAAGIDREVRFHDLCGINIDMSKVPEVNGKRDFSSLKDESNFWILPLSYKDDEFKTDHSVNDSETPLADETKFPTLDESDWINNGHDKKIAEKLRDGGYDAVFLTGGNQARYMECLTYPDGSDTPVLAIIREIFEERGGVVAGTSAGGAVLSQTMMMGGGSFGAMVEGVVYEDIDVTHYEDEHTPFKDLTDKRVWLGHGFGLLNPCIISDTHFVARGRIGRLITACLHLKASTGRPMIGMGADEDSAIILRPDGSGEVCGALGAVIVDTSKAILVQGKPQNGKYLAKNIKINYLENEDKFNYNCLTGEINVLSVSSTKKHITEPEFSDGHNYFFETDIFGKEKLKKIITHYLTDNNAQESIGIELSDNYEDGYDEIPFKDVEKCGSVLIRFRKEKDTAAYKGNISYHWWGKGDKNYPDLITVNDTDRYSVANVYADIFPLSINQFPDFSECEHVPLKNKYIQEGASEDDWYDLFDEKKKFKFGAIVIPIDNLNAEIRTFFYDYAYNDYDDDGRYSPPKLKPEGHKGGFKDYDIGEMDEVKDAQIFINGNLAGTTDAYGKCTIPLTEKNIIKAVYTGSKDYTVEFPLNSGFTEAKIIFEE